MKKFFLTFLLIGAVVAAAVGHRSAVLAEDLCGGTGGNGQIVSVGDREFTMRRNDDGRSQKVYLTSKAIINTSTGIVSPTDLKTGMRVTLVGGPNRDGSFSAEAVFVCSETNVTGTQENGGGQAVPTLKRVENNGYKKVRAVINVLTILVVGWIWLLIAAYFRVKKKESLTYLLFLTIFYIYIYKVLDYTLIQFQSLLLLKHFVPNLLLNGVPVGRIVNLIPLATLTIKDVKTSLLNILMMMPFGFGLPFVTNFKFKKTVAAGLIFSFGIELLQFVTGFIANTTFRIADVNDLIFNTAGVAVGYVLFILFTRIFRQLTRNRKMGSNPLVQYIADRPQINSAGV